MNGTLKRVDTTPIIARMAELCPQCIFVYEGRRQPLKTGIYADIIAKVAGAITPDELKLALRSYVRNIGYQKAMARPGAMRIDIEGNPVEAVAPEHMASAAKAVAAHWARQAERKAAARMACAEPEAPASRPMHLSAAPMSEKPKRLGLADLRQLALARKAAIR
jgi:ProP effector